MLRHNSPKLSIFPQLPVQDSAFLRLPFAKYAIVDSFYEQFSRAAESAVRVGIA